MNESVVLHVKNVHKVHRQSWFGTRNTFSLDADFALQKGTVTGVFGPNGAGKSSLFDLIAGHVNPSRGQILCHGQNIHRVKYPERCRLVRYVRQNQYNRFSSRIFPPNFLLEPARCGEPTVHLFDEPNGEEWITEIFFNAIVKLRMQGNTVLFAMHPSRLLHIERIHTICDEVIYVDNGRYMRFSSFKEMENHQPARRYLAPLFEMEKAPRH